MCIEIIYLTNVQNFTSQIFNQYELSGGRAYQTSNTSPPAWKLNTLRVWEHLGIIIIESI